MSDEEDVEEDVNDLREWWFTRPPEVKCPGCGLNLGKRAPDVQLLLDVIHAHQEEHHRTGR